MAKEVRPDLKPASLSTRNNTNINARNSEVMEALKAKQVQHFDWTYTTRYSGTIDTQHLLVPVDVCAAIILDVYLIVEL